MLENRKNPPARSRAEIAAGKNLGMGAVQVCGSKLSAHYTCWRLLLAALDASRQAALPPLNMPRGWGKVYRQFLPIIAFSAWSRRIPAEQAQIFMSHSSADFAKSTAARGSSLRALPPYSRSLLRISVPV